MRGVVIVREVTSRGRDDAVVIGVWQLPHPDLFVSDPERRTTRIAF